MRLATILFACLALLSLAACTTETTESTTTSSEPTSSGGNGGAPSEAPAPVSFEPVVLSGSGQTATDAVSLPKGVFTATWQYTGASNFIVQVYDDEGGEDLMVNTIGAYSGVRPLAGPGKFTFDINASGDWTLTIAAIGGQDGIAFSGAGDAVSGLFPVSGSNATLNVSHDGQSNFIVQLHCDGGRDLFQNEIGPVTGSRVLRFPRNSKTCFWEVRADGNWSITG